MVTRFYIRHGDQTNVGGTVRSGSGTQGVFDRGMAYEGDVIGCPQCHGTGQIVCDGPRWSFTAEDGRQAALSGDICLCKCNPSPRLIANQILMSMDTTGAPGSASGGNNAADSEFHLPKDEQFLLRDPSSGRLWTNAPYQIKTAAGDIISGTTNVYGRTERVKTDDPQSLVFLLLRKGQA